MGRREIENTQHACTEHRKKAQPNAFWKASRILKPHFEKFPVLSVASLNNKERRALKAHQLKFEHKQLEAISIVRQRIL